MPASLQQAAEVRPAPKCCGLTPQGLICAFLFWADIGREQGRQLRFVLRPHPRVWAYLPEENQALYQG
jgi:hypothetical protein